MVTTTLEQDIAHFAMEAKAVNFSSHGNFEQTKAALQASLVNELPGVSAAPKKRGRPSTGKALTNAERQARNRNWKKLSERIETERLSDACSRLTDSDLAGILYHVVPLPDFLLRSDVFRELGRRNGWL